MTERFTPGNTRRQPAGCLFLVHRGMAGIDSMLIHCPSPLTPCWPSLANCDPINFPRLGDTTRGEALQSGTVEP